MTEIDKIEIRIVSTLLVNTTVMIAGKLISGDIYGGKDSSVYFDCSETGGKWKLVALGFLSPKELDENIRSFGVEHVEGNNQLEEGYTLISH